MGRSTGSRNVRLRSNTWAIKTPKGFVTRNTATKKTKISSHPFEGMVARTFLDTAGPRTNNQESKRKFPTTEYFRAFRLLLKAVATANVGHRHQKKSNRHDDKNDVLHWVHPVRALGALCLVHGG